MFNETNFIVRVSGKRENSCYIDCQGEYKVAQIARIVGLQPVEVEEIYLSNGADYDSNNDVYYFAAIEYAKKTISEILNKMKPEYRGKLIFLTESEIEYIRKALINEGSNVLHLHNNIKDALFKKLNK